MRRALLCCSAVTAFACQGQMVLQAGTTLTVDGGTTVGISTPAIFTVQSGSTLVNNGLIDFSEYVDLDEQPGAPITGTGTEITYRTYPTPLTSTDAAGLGFILTTAISPDSLIVERGHLPRVNNINAEGIARWYHLRTGAVQGLGATAVLRYDLTELNGIPEAVLRMARNGDGGIWWPELGSTLDLGAHNATAAVPDSLGWFTLFDDAVITNTATIIDDSEGWLLFPTVADGSITVKGTTPIRTMIVLDAQGRRIDATTRQHAAQAELDVSQLASGAYCVLVNGVHLLRFVKP